MGLLSLILEGAAASSASILPTSDIYLTVQELQVDGDLLLNITDQDLIADLGMTAGLTRKRQVVQTL